MKTEKEINNLLEKAERAAETPKCFSQSYEDGVVAALQWVLGELPENESIL